MQHKVGDWVRIRQWDDMEAEYGMDVYGNILVPLTFTDTMREFCGHWGRITRVYECSYDIKFLFAPSGWSWNDEMMLNNWSWNDEMLEPEPVYYPGDRIQLRSWADMQADFNMNGLGPKNDNPTCLSGDFSKFFVDVPLTIKEIKTYKQGDERIEGIIVEDMPKPEFSFQYFEFTKYCIDCVIKDSATIIAPTVSFDDLFSVTL